MEPRLNTRPSWTQRVVLSCFEVANFTITWCGCYWERRGYSSYTLIPTITALLQKQHKF